MTTVKPWKAPTCPILWLYFVLWTVSSSDATCWNAVVVVLTWRGKKMKPFKTTRKKKSPFFSFPKAFVYLCCIISKWILHVSWIQLCLCSKKETELSLSFLPWKVMDTVMQWIPKAALSCFIGIITARASSFFNSLGFIVSLFMLDVEWPWLD